MTSIATFDSSNNRLSHETEKAFRMMGFNTLVQLRDCLMDLFETRVVENGLVQSKYLLETLRRLLVDGNTSMDMRGLILVKGNLMVGLIERFGYAFALGVKLLHSSTSQDRELLLQSLEEIFEIMCFQKAFESPIVLCATYIALLNSPSDHNGKKTRQLRVDTCFSRMVSTLNSVGYDLVLQEMLATGLEDVRALEALRIALDNCPDGYTPTYMD